MYKTCYRLTKSCLKNSHCKMLLEYCNNVENFPRSSSENISAYIILEVNI